MPLEFKMPEANERLVELGIHCGRPKFDYKAIGKDLQKFKSTGQDTKFLETVRFMTKADVFFLCYFVLDLPVNHPFLMARIYEAQQKHHMTLDLWFREGWKSTILTEALPIWELIHNPNERIGIFSHTRVLAKSHLRKIKSALESNETLLRAFPDVFYEKPTAQAPKWSEDDGLFVKRHRVFGEASVEAWGIVETMPTGKHFSTMIYDDVVVPSSVTNAEMLRKTAEAFKQSTNLGARGGKKRVIGTRYHHRDYYAELIQSPKWTVRKRPVEVDENGNAQRGGIPVFLSRDEIELKYEAQGRNVFAAQMLLDPTAEDDKSFQRHWLRFEYLKDRPTLNYYCTVDAARSKKADADYTVMAVIGTDYKRNYWLVDMIRDRLSLLERWEKLKGLVQSYGLSEVGYEQYGMMGDVDYMREMMDLENFYFNIVELKGNTPKEKRIERLLPVFERGRFILPYSMIYEGRDLIEEFMKEEYELFPLAKHDDMLDCISRIIDPAMGVTFPPPARERDKPDDGYDPLFLKRDRREARGWMAEGID